MLIREPAAIRAKRLHPTKPTSADDLVYPDYRGQPANDDPSSAMDRGNSLSTREARTDSNDCMNRPLARIRSLTILACALYCAGCGIPKSVAWVGNADGLIYHTGDGGIGHLDLNTGQNRVILEKQLTGTTAPAASPKGDRFALLKVNSLAREDQLELVVYDMDGKLVHRTDKHRWPADNGTFTAPAIRPAAAIWSPSGRYILFWYSRPTTGEFVYGKYDFQTGMLKPIGPIIPLVDLQLCGLSPIRPDDVGFLAVRNKNAGWNNLYFVRWDGWEYPIITPQVVMNELARMNPAAAGGPFLLQRPIPKAPVIASGWKDGAITLGMGQGDFTIDTVTQTVTYENALPAEQDEREASRDKAVVARLPIGDGSFAVQCRLVPNRGKETYLLEVVEPATGRVQPIGFAGATPEFIAISPAMRSPDQTMVAVTYVMARGKVFTTIVDDQGKVRATIQTAGDGWKQSLKKMDSVKPKAVASIQERKSG